MYFPMSFTKDLAKKLNLLFNKLGTDSLVGITNDNHSRVMDKLEDFIDETQYDWEDPIEVDQMDTKSIFDNKVTYCYLVCTDQDDAWEVIIAESDIGTVVSANRV